MTKEQLLEMLEPLLKKLSDIDLEQANPRSAVEGMLPFESAEIQALCDAATDAYREGWLTYKGDPELRFGRLSKDHCGFSVDAVYMERPGPRHRHPNGEIDLCIAIDGEPTFDGQSQGWVVYPPDSVHVPTVRDGAMLVLYFLPGGAFEIVEE